MVEGKESLSGWVLVLLTPPLAEIPLAACERSPSSSSQLLLLLLQLMLLTSCWRGGTTHQLFQHLLRADGQSPPFDCRLITAATLRLD